MIYVSKKKKFKKKKKRQARSTPKLWRLLEQQEAGREFGVVWL